jgi:uncharacterized protein
MTSTKLTEVIGLPAMKESALALSAAIYNEIVPAGEGWIREIPQGHYFRIVDVEGNQSADTFFWNARDYEDRYSAQDTIRAQGNIYVTEGTKLMSSRCNVLLTVVADTCGRHDTLGGACATESNMVRYAIDRRYMHACRQSFVKSIVKWGRGLEKRDIGYNTNFFMNVPVTPVVPWLGSSSGRKVRPTIGLMPRTSK